MDTFMVTVMGTAMGTLWVRYGYSYGYIYGYSVIITFRGSHCLLLGWLFLTGDSKGPIQKL